MHVVHLYHSGVKVELDQCTLVFDWWYTKLPGWGKDELRLRPDKKLFVFVSHAHHDHYRPDIWDLADRYPQTHATFVVDQAIASDAPAHGNVDLVPCQPDQAYELGGLEVQTMRSTDEGLAFYASCQGTSVYHAGDLNVWWWPNRDISLNEQSVKDCADYLAPIEGRRVDLAFVPLDPRLGAGGDRGLELYMQHVGSNVVVPIHYGDDLAVAKRLASSKRLKPWSDRILFADELDL